MNIADTNGTPQVRGRASAMAALSASVLLASLGAGAANVILPRLALAFSAPMAEVQWVVLAYLLALTTVIVGVGRLGDLHGPRRLLVAGAGLFTAGSLACAVAPSLGALIAARAAQGAGAATMMALAMAAVRDIVPRAQTGSAMGLLGTMSAVGTALGPALGGPLAAACGWRAVFAILVPMGCAATVLAWRAIPIAAKPASSARAPFDGRGAIVLAVALLAYGLAWTDRGQGFGAVNAGLLGAALAGAMLFMRVEARAAAPLVPLDSLSGKLLRQGLATNALVSTVMMATLVVGPFYLAHGLALGEAAIGLVLATGPAVSIACGIPAGRAVDRLGSRRMALAGLAIMALGSLAMALLPPALGLAGYLAALFLLTPGYQLFQAANNTATLVDVPPDRRGVVSGMLALARNLGLVTGASAMGAVFGLASGATHGHPASADAMAAGLRVTFLLATGLMGLALALAWPRDRR